VTDVHDDDRPDGGREPRGIRRLRLAMAAGLSFMTALHLLRPALFVPMVPAWIPGDPELLHGAATAAEGLSAVLLWNRRTARAGGLLAALTFIGVFPANVEAVRLGGYAQAPGWLSTRTAAVLRLPLQLPLIWWAGRISRGQSSGV
jgi:uncharacterized membrane protein